MSSSSCPLDVDVQNKLASVGAGLEADIRAWVEGISGEKFPDKNFGKSLKNGIILCKYVIEGLRGVEMKSKILIFIQYGKQDKTWCMCQAFKICCSLCPNGMNSLSSHSFIHSFILIPYTGEHRFLSCCLQKVRSSSGMIMLQTSIHMILMVIIGGSFHDS